MAEQTDRQIVVGALLRALQTQGQGGGQNADSAALTQYPVQGSIDVLALADAVQNALGGSDATDDGKTPAELNAANDG